MQYGHFDTQQREYVITDPRTPVKWINYIGTRDFGGFVDHTGGALICKDDPTFNRITKYVQQMPSSDFKGETLYIRLHTPDGYRIFSPFYVPTLDPLDSYECHVGLGYTRIISQVFGLRTEVTIFVPRGELREVREIRITNVSSSALTVDVIPVVEYTHPEAMKQFTNADWVPQTMQSQAVKDGEFTLLFQYPFMNRDRQVNCFSSSLPVASFESDRKIFLGDNEYGTFGKPGSLLKPEFSNSEARRGDNIGALMHHLGVIKSGETTTLITQLSQAADMESAKAGMKKFRQPQAVKTALEEISAFWDNYLSSLQVETPDADMNSMLNIHNPYQCYVTKTWSRYLSYYQLGMGSRGIGMRDSSQDVLAVLAAVPQEGKEFLRTLLSFQKRDGSAMHQFNPLTLVGSVGDSIEMEDHPHYYSDDHLWVILGVTAYLKETGDYAFLEEIIPFYDKDRTDRPLESGTVLEHLKRGLTFTGRDTGAHGLPLLGFADWNDTVNLPTGAESLFTANLYGKALTEMIDLTAYLGDRTTEHGFRQAYETMKTNFNICAWDGEWFVRYFDAQGTPLGSTKNTYGQIYLNGQSWPVISGFAEAEHGRKAMESVYRKLNTKYGIKLSAPGFNGYDPAYGGVTTFPPGTKENGGIFLHPNPWAMIAETMLGNGDRAYEYYAQINPVSKNDNIDLYECEPYVYGQNILGDEHKQFGLGRNSWLSGTASWCYQAATQWILGVRAEYTGLRVDPCIPKAWDEFAITRRFRGESYHITVHNPQHVCKGVARLEVDGQPIPGSLVPLDGGTGVHKVEVWLGE
ncbi:MAG TPA: glycosyl hydrolase family 65 protein [Longilinea sp.]|nr:glycosyl hydrolase family 65 protein [Longilinea sp.]